MSSESKIYPLHTRKKMKIIHDTGGQFRANIEQRKKIQKQKNHQPKRAYSVSRIAALISECKGKSSIV